MRSHPGRTVAGVAAAAVLVTMWLFFAPTQVGGAATYSITEGISMKPLLHKNDLAIVRAQSTYRVGDAVLYESSTLHRPVLHRILVIQDGHYFFKGDNNNFVDPGYATKSELTGKLWFHAPAVGGILGWIGKPLHAALIAGLTVIFLLFGGVRTRRRRGRRHRDSAVVPHAPPERTRRPATSMAPPAIASLTVLLAIGGFLSAAGFATPSHRLVDRQDAYSHTGTFSLLTRTIKPSASYPGGIATIDQPLFAKLFKTTTSGFRYRFVSKLPHHVHGTIGFKAVVLSSVTGWQNLSTIKAKRPFSGDTAKTGAVFLIKDLYTLVNKVSAAAGTPGAEYSVSLQPVVHVVGVVDGKRIDSTFSPALPFSVTPLVVKLDVAPATAPPGATYKPQTGHSALNAVVHPVQAGTIPSRADNYLTIARYHVSVDPIRWIGLLALALAALVAIFHRRLWRPDERPEEEQIAAHLGCLVTPVDALTLPAGETPTPVHDFTSLATLALYLERPILRQSDETGRHYAVDDKTRAYQYDAAPARQLQPVTTLPAATVTPRRPARRPSRLGIAAALVALLIAVTLATSLTANTNVPTSRAGSSSQTRQISQLKPAGCSSLTLTTLVVRTGNFTNTASNALVLGTATANTITDNGTHNCIIGGGGKDTVNGDNTDICIIGPSPGTKYKKCTTSA